MTEKEQHIIEYLNNHNGIGYYLDIRKQVGQEFDDQTDFDLTLDILKRKKWIYENEPGDTLYHLNSEMTKSKPFEIELTGYNILSNGVDGGHYYISTEIKYQGKIRKLTALFLEKSEEIKLNQEKTLNIIGDLMDDGLEHSLMLLNTTIKE